MLKIIKSQGVKFNITHHAGPTLAKINNRFLNMESCEYLIERASKRVIVTGSSKVLTSEVGTAEHLRPVSATDSEHDIPE